MPESFSVFVKFRHRRLTLMRRIPTLADAAEFATRIRALRFHDPDSVFIVDDRTGQIVRENDAAAEPSERRQQSGVEEKRALACAEASLEQTIVWLQQARRELPGLHLDEALDRLETVRSDLAQARGLLETAQALAGDEQRADAG